MYVLVTSPRVAPGLMTLAAWDALRGAERILCPDLDDPTADSLRTLGFEVETGPAPVEVSVGTVWLAPVGDVGWADDLAERLLDEASERADVEVVFGSYDLPGARLLDLVAVMDRLRRECPWTREQTHESLSGYLLEESYEVLEALDNGDHDHLREELGDVLMQVVFHAAVAQGREGDGWSVDDVAEEIVAKLIHRNPHVFGDAEVTTAAEVDANWRALKAEKKGRRPALEGIPSALPALAYADMALDRLERQGAPALPDGSDIGSRLLSLVREARARGVDAETALRRVVRGLVS